MGLVDDHTAPLDGVELGAASQDHLERCDDGPELVGASYHAALETRKKKKGDRLYQTGLLSIYKTHAYDLKQITSKC